MHIHVAYVAHIVLDALSKHTIKVGTACYVRQIQFWPLLRARLVLFAKANRILETWA